MAQLFNRRVVVTVAPLGAPALVIGRTAPLRIMFSVTKDTSSAENTAEVSIINLNADHRAFIESYKENGGAKLVVSAGYAPPGAEALTGRIFEGDIVPSGGVENRYERPDWATTIKAASGARAMANAKVSKSFKGKTSQQNIFDAITTPMKSQGLAVAPPKGVPAGSTRKGFSLGGLARDLLDSFSRDHELDWFVDDGELIVLPVDEVSDADIIVLSPTTGLLESPVKTEKGVKAKALINPNIKPGREVRVESRAFSGRRFKVEKLVHKGDNREGAYFTELEATDLGRVPGVTIEEQGFALA